MATTIDSIRADITLLLRQKMQDASVYPTAHELDFIRSCTTNKIEAIKLVRSIGGHFSLSTSELTAHQLLTSAGFTVTRPENNSKFSCGLKEAKDIIELILALGAFNQQAVTDVVNSL